MTEPVHAMSNLKCTPLPFNILLPEREKEIAPLGPTAAAPLNKITRPPVTPIPIAVLRNLIRPFRLLNNLKANGARLFRPTIPLFDNNPMSPVDSRTIILFP